MFSGVEDPTASLHPESGVMAVGAAVVLYIRGSSHGGNAQLCKLREAFRCLVMLF
jgi:hypothetical protein